MFTRGGTRADGQITYRATTHLISSSTLSSSAAAFRGTTNLQAVAALVTIGEVPRRVAEEIGFEGDPRTLVFGIEVITDPTAGLLSITAASPDAERAQLLADTFGEQLIGYLRQRTLDVARLLTEEIEELDQQITELDGQLALVSGEREQSLLEERDSLDFSRQALTLQYSQLAASLNGNPSGLEILERATPVAVDPGSLVPSPPWIRLSIAGLLGLAVGFAIVLLLERLNPRIESKESAESAFRLPVLGEIPVIPRRRRSSVVAGAFPSAPASNAFRLLAAALQFGRPRRPVGSESSNGDRAWQTLLVTSAAPSEGKSTTVANLAATFADVGKRVIVLCCDFRHPSLHATFDARQTPGLSDILAAEGPVRLEGVLQETTLEGVRVLSTGRVPDNTGGLLGSDRMRDVLAEARTISDVILIDTAPVLAASDWAQLVPVVDAVLFVTRAGRTDAGSAARAAEILETLQAPTVGVVLNRVPRSLLGTARYGYGFGHGTYGSPSEGEEQGRATSPAKAETMVSPNGEPGESEPADRLSATPDGEFPHLARPSTKE